MVKPPPPAPPPPPIKAKIVDTTATIVGSGRLGSRDTKMQDAVHAAMKQALAKGITDPEEFRRIKLKAIEKARAKG